MDKSTARNISRLIALALLVVCASFFMVSCAEVPSTPPAALAPAPKTKPTPTPDPNSAAAKAAEKERNLQPRPAPQTGTHL